MMLPSSQLRYSALMVIFTGCFVSGGYYADLASKTTNSEWPTKYDVVAIFFLGGMIFSLLFLIINAIIGLTTKKEDKEFLEIWNKHQEQRRKEKFQGEGI